MSARLALAGRSMKPEDERFVRTVIARGITRALARLRDGGHGLMPDEIWSPPEQAGTGVANVPAKPREIIPENIPDTLENGGKPGWSTQDSIGCWNEYIAMCREEHLQGKPVPSFFLSNQPVAASEEREVEGRPLRDTGGKAA